MLIVKPDALQPDHWICSWVDSNGEVQTSSIQETLLKFIGSADPTSRNKSFISPERENTHPNDERSADTPFN